MACQLATLKNTLNNTIWCGVDPKWDIIQIAEVKVQKVKCYKCKSRWAIQKSLELEADIKHQNSPSRFSSLLCGKVYNKCDILTTLRGNDCLWFLMAIFNYICLVSGGPKLTAAKGFSYYQMIKIGLNNLATVTTYFGTFC